MIGDSPVGRNYLTLEFEVRSCQAFAHPGSGTPYRGLGPSLRTLRPKKTLATEIQAERIRLSSAIPKRVVIVDDRNKRDAGHISQSISSRGYLPGKSLIAYDGA